MSFVPPRQPHPAFCLASLRLVASPAQNVRAGFTSKSHGSQRRKRGAKMATSLSHEESDHNQDATAAARLNAFRRGSQGTDHEPLIQPIQPPIAEPPTVEERRMVHHYRALRARIHDGPFYTILDSTARVGKSGQRSPPAAHFNPFDSAPTYSQQFVRKRNTLPRLSTRPFGQSPCRNEMGPGTC